MAIDIEIISDTIGWVWFAVCDDRVTSGNCFQEFAGFFGKYVQEQVFLYVSWALPVLVGATAVTLMLIAAV